MNPVPCAVLGAGSFGTCLAILLAERGYSVAVYDARFAKPLDLDLLRELADSGMPVITVEDHQRIGGFGSCVIEACHALGLSTRQFHCLGLPDRWIYQGSRGDQQAEAGIDAAGIARTAAEILDRGAAAKVEKRVGTMKVAG